MFLRRPTFPKVQHGGTKTTARKQQHENNAWPELKLKVGGLLAADIK